tara:strand:+ start:5839 stop:7665 length:1827 start_codon:yes stop_codon:yes gene_type:complete
MLNNTTISQLLSGPINQLITAYQQRRVAPLTIVEDIIERSEALAEHNIWIVPPSMTCIEPYLAMLGNHPDEEEIKTRPLWGVPFAIKDNIDLAGVPTSAACPAFTYMPGESAFVVEQLIAAGAIPIGKTNLDQFATGLVGTRSPFGVVTHPDRPELISGGSSAGSAIAVACGLASFSLGTDTAGSGRIPAGFNDLVGIKPSRGLISTMGVVPACRTLDCVSIFSRSVADGAMICNAATVYDTNDPYARENTYKNDLSHFGVWGKAITLGVLSEDLLNFFDDPTYAQAYRETLAALRAADVQLKTIDFTAFRDAARELYEGPWVTERYIAIADMLDHSPEAVRDDTRTIIAAGAEPSAVAVFESKYRLAALRSECLHQLEGIDALLTPTAGRHYSVQALANDPFTPNSNLGYYTNYMNLLDMCGVALPGRSTAQAQPFGITLVGNAFADTKLLSLAAALETLLSENNAASAAPASPLPNNDTIDIAVCGAHLEGLPLNWQLTSRGGQLISKQLSAACYRLFALQGGPPFRPGMIRDEANGRAIEIEVWRLPAETFASFMTGIPWPLGIGKVEIASGEQISGFICESAGLEGATDISHFGGWRAYLASVI